jgi:hypothetical protein
VNADKFASLYYARFDERSGLIAIAKSDLKTDSNRLERTVTAKDR